MFAHDNARTDGGMVVRTLNEQPSSLETRVGGADGFQALLGRKIRSAEPDPVVGAVREPQPEADPSYWIGYSYGYHSYGRFYDAEYGIHLGGWGYRPQIVYG